MQRSLPLASLVTGADQRVAGDEIQLHRGTAESVEDLQGHWPLLTPLAGADSGAQRNHLRVPRETDEAEG